jgi:hypothetical protein
VRGAIKLALAAAGVFAAYKIVDSARRDPNETHLDGWQRTAENMRPTPKSAVELANEAHPRAPLPQKNQS